MTTSPATIDGALGDAAWQDAQVVREFSIPGVHLPPVHRTEARITWDRQFLYVAFRAIDPDVGAIHTERDSDTYRDDVLEVFFKTQRKAETYYNFEINPLGTVRDEYHTSAKRFQIGWDCTGLKIGVKIGGTLNNPKDRDQRWQLEIAIPFASLPTLKGKAPVPGDVWLFHLARIDRSANLKDGEELTSCAPLSKTWFHDPERWLPLVFQGTK